MTVLGRIGMLSVDDEGPALPVRFAELVERLSVGLDVGTDDEIVPVMGPVDKPEVPGTEVPGTEVPGKEELLLNE